MLCIKEMRKKKKLSGPKLAEMLHITPTHLYDMENEKKRIHAEMLSKIADIFETSVDYLLCRTNDPTPPDLDKTAFLTKKQHKLLELSQHLKPEELDIFIDWLDALVEKKMNKKNLYLVAESPPPDLLKTPMAAYSEYDTQISVTPALEDIIIDGIQESRKKKKESEKRNGECK